MDVANAPNIQSLAIGPTVASRTWTMLKIQQKADRGAVMLTVSGRLDAANVAQLCELLDAIRIDMTVALDLQDLVLADRVVVRLLREFEERKRVVLRNCPSYIRIWMAAEDIQ